VELRGFEPLTTRYRRPRAVTAPPLPRANTAEAAPLNPTLDRRCFPCPSRGQYVEGLADLDENRRVTRRGLVSARAHVDVERIQFDAPCAVGFASRSMIFI
jgi:hypothetical protein